MANQPSLRGTRQEGFTIIEMMITMTLLLVVSGTVLKGVMDMTQINEVMVVRTDMHNGVRNATELLTQEVGQAGRISLPGLVTMQAANIGETGITVSSTAGMFIGEQLILDVGDAEETVEITDIPTGTTLTIIDDGDLDGLDKDHAAGASVRVAGGFAAGVVPPGTMDGSTGSVLKIFGDIDGDGTGQMSYVEYVCDLDDDGFGRLYRNSMDIDEDAKSAPNVEQILIDNIQENPEDLDGNPVPCFTYQTQTVVGTTYVIDVAITLTVRTERVDPVTGQRQTETKALLNVSPRNVFNVWQLASLNILNRVQPMPDSVLTLLPCVGPCE